MTVIMWLSGSSSYTDNDYSIVLRAASSHGRDVLLSIVENRSQLHSLIKVSQRLITIEFYIRWPTGPWPAQISLLVVVSPPTSKRISGQQFADFRQWKSVPAFLIYQGPSTKSNTRVLRLMLIQRCSPAPISSYLGPCLQQTRISAINNSSISIS